MSDGERLAGYVEVWWRSVADLVALLDELTPEDWARPTDLDGWDVHAVAAHLAHLESLLAGAPEEVAEVPAAPHITGPMGQFTEIGVITRRDRDPVSIVEEIRAATSLRHAALMAEPPREGTAPAPGLFGLIGWDQATLLSNRPLDVWMHEQDIRRAVARPGGMDTAGARHAADRLLEGFGFVVGKRVAPPPGTTVVLLVAGSAPVAVRVGEDGRARRLDAPPAEATVRIETDRESFIVLAGGRRDPEPGAVVVTGDVELGQRILARLATTP